MKWAAWPCAQRCACYFPQGWRLCCRPTATSSHRRFIWFLDVLPWQYWAYCWYCRIVTLWYAAVCRIDVTTATQLFNQHNKVSPPLGHWNPETLEPRVETPGHWNLGTLEPRVHREEKGHRPENREWAPTRGTVFSFFRYTPWQSLAVSPLRVSLPSRSWRSRRPGWCTLVAGTVFGLSFPETLKGRCGPTVAVELSGRRL